MEVGIAMAMEECWNIQSTLHPAHLCSHSLPSNLADARGIALIGGKGGDRYEAGRAGVNITPAW